MAPLTRSLTARGLLTSVVALICGLLLGVAPAAAATVTVSNPPPVPATGELIGDSCGPAVPETVNMGQSFVATASGELTTLTLYPPQGEGEFTGLFLVFRADQTFEDPPIAEQQHVSFDGAPVTTTFTEPASVVQGESYRFLFLCAEAGTGEFFFLRSDGYTQGELYANGRAYPDWDLAFSLTIETDADGDGVEATDDACPGTTDDSALAPTRLNPNHYWTTPDGFVDRDGHVVYSLADTGGCSASQIIDAAGLGAGHTRHGIPDGALRAWVARPQP
jgi:hypothetical protein